jgi:hypothetical protein
MGGVVISGGRVVDPASGMDSIGDVALLDGKIAAVGTRLGGAERVIDATWWSRPGSSTCTRMASRSRRIEGIKVDVLERVGQFSPNKTGAKGSYTVYHVASGSQR